MEVLEKASTYHIQSRKRKTIGQCEIVSQNLRNKHFKELLSQRLCSWKIDRPLVNVKETKWEYDNRDHQKSIESL